MSGVELKSGDTVEIGKIPDWLLHDLPQEDQDAIRSKVGAKAPIIAFDAHGHAEIEFDEADEGSRTIWIDPDCLRKI
jgi:RHS repeat-associated protein